MAYDGGVIPMKGRRNEFGAIPFGERPPARAQGMIESKADPEDVWCDPDVGFYDSLLRGLME